VQGCASSHADVRGDAAKLARRLMGRAPHRAQTINLSGCEKRCAMRNGATVELVASPSGYNISIGGNLLDTERSSESAIDLAVSSLRAHGQTNNHESQLC
jgi:sulfite reductase beta subunit-like hemoprotein